MTAPTNNAPRSAGQNGAHTPGPWAAFDNEIEADDGLNDNRRIADTFGPDAKANAHLIAAAPEVVEHAARVMALLAAHGQSIVPHLLDSDDNAGQRLRTAIAKATGEGV